MEPNDKKIDWHSFINEHPLFSGISSTDISNLLDSNNSTYRTFEPNNIIFRAGEISNTFFLIGEGSVNVELSSEDSNATNICTLHKGDFFGEMSAIDDQSARAATISANEKCELLEIKSRPFQQVLKNNPELEFKLLSMLTSRLRHVNDHLLKNTRLTYDTKFSLLSEKIESQSKVVEASLNASHAVFEQTKIRTDEIIHAAERGRTRITWILSTLTAGFTLLLALFSFFGYDKLDLAQEKLDSIGETEKSINITKTSVEDTLKSIAIAKTKVDAVNSTIDELKASIEESESAKRILFETLISMFSARIDEKFNPKTEKYKRDAISDIEKLGNHILKINDSVVTIKFFKALFFDVQDSLNYISSNKDKSKTENFQLNRARISYYTVFMYQYINAVSNQQDPNELALFLSNYVLLTTYAMNEEFSKDNSETFDIRLGILNNKYNNTSGNNLKKQIDEDFISDLKDIDLPQSVKSSFRKNSIDNIWASRQ